MSDTMWLCLISAVFLFILAGLGALQAYLKHREKQIWKGKWKP